MRLSPADNDRQGDTAIVSSSHEKSNKNSDWKPFKRVPNAQAIADGLKIIPSDWSLTPVQDKSPKRSNWQTEEFIPHQEIARLILHGEKKVSQKGNEYINYWSGFGLRTGDYSNGILTTDVDGASAEPLLKAISKGDLPTTVDWTSGKPGRYQQAYRMPEEIRPLLRDFKRAVLTEWEGLKTACDEEGKPTELLEFRYNCVQSVLPPSRHPDTGAYKWIHSPEDTEVAIAPKWLCDLIIKLATRERAKEQEYKQRAVDWANVERQAKYQGGVVTDLVDFLKFDVLPRLSVDQIFNWSGHNFREYGKTLKGNPPWRQSVSGTSFHVWWDGQEWAWQDKATGEGGGAIQYRWKLKGGSGTPKGKDFVQILTELALDAGVEMPEMNNHNQDTYSKEESFNEDDFSTSLDTSSLNPDIEFNQKALNFLYGDKPWMCADDRLYRWQGNHYKYVPDAVERPKIASFCNSYVVHLPIKDGGSKPTFPYAKPAKVEEVLKWVKMRFEKDPNLLNPSGINCTNGVVGVRWENGKPIRYLEKHDPNKHYYTYEPLVKYDPEADTIDCDRLLQCLDEPQQQVLLRNLGASIDLPEVRKRRGREVKVLLACGLGSNGKDALRQVVSTIFGHSGMTSISLADFSEYDAGRKFALAPLMYSRVNWASENPQTSRLDKIQSLKLFATGNLLHSERKGKDHVEFIPKAVGLFNLNEVPSLQGTIQAIQDRIAPLQFLKTFKKDPDPNDPNELQADPRFAYDEDFVRTSVAPAFLNKMLDALEALIEEGIDYSCTASSFRSMQKENNHLWQFCEDVGLSYLPAGEMTAKELWSQLEQWYIENGTLVIEDDGKKRQWTEQVRPSDKNVKGINQVIPRILSLFPKAKKGTRYDDVAKRSVPIISGIGIITPPLFQSTNENTRATNENTRTIPAPLPAPLPAPETLINQATRTTRTTFIESCEIENKNSERLGCLPPEIKKEERTAETGAGGAEPRHRNTSDCGNWCGTGAGNVNSGAGNVNKELEPDFDPQANAELMLEALEDENPYAMLSALLECWTEEQKAEVRSRLEPQQVEAIRNVLRQQGASASVTATETPNIEKPATTPTLQTSSETKPSSKIGDRVKSLRDAFDGAHGCEGVVVDHLWGDVNRTYATGTGDR